jgi:hypothetical protein
MATSIALKRLAGATTVLVLMRPGPEPLAHNRGFESRPRYLRKGPVTGPFRWLGHLSGLGRLGGVRTEEQTAVVLVRVGLLCPRRVL